MSKLILIALLVFANTFDVARGLYFELGAADSKCFVQDMEKDAMLIIDYRIEQQPQAKPKAATATPSDLALKVVITDSDSKVVHSRVYDVAGKIPFTASSSGNLIICLETAGRTNWFRWSLLHLHLDIRTGVQAIDYGAVAKKDRLSELQLRIRQLQDQVREIAGRQFYQREREQRFRYTSESTRSSVFWWPVIQILVVVCIGIWQMKHLKQFFLKKKLV